MAKAIALTRQHASKAIEPLRLVMVLSCGGALIVAGKALPALI